VQSAVAESVRSGGSGAPPPYSGVSSVLERAQSLLAGRTGGGTGADNLERFIHTPGQTDQWLETAPPLGGGAPTHNRGWTSEEDFEAVETGVPTHNRGWTSEEDFEAVEPEWWETRPGAEGTGAVGDAITNIPDANITVGYPDYGFLGELLADSRRFAAALVDGNQQAIELSRDSITALEQAFWSDYQDDAALLGGDLARSQPSRLDIYAQDILIQQGISNAEIAAVSLITDRRMEQIDERTEVIRADLARRVGVAAASIKEDAIAHILSVNQVKQAQAQIDAMNQQNAAIEASYQQQWDMYERDLERRGQDIEWLLEGTPQEIAAKMAALELVGTIR